MNSNQVTDSAVTEWAKAATIIYRQAMEDAPNDPRCIEWLERAEAQQAARPERHQWTREMLVRQWLEKNPPAFPPVPIPQPSWASEMTIDPMRDHDDMFEWNFSWSGDLAGARISQTAVIFDDRDLTMHDLMICIPGEEDTYVNAKDLDRIIDTLTQVRAALNA